MIGQLQLELFLSMLLGMSLHCFFGMPPRMKHVAPRGVSVVCRLFVIAGLVIAWLLRRGDWLGA